MITQEQKNSLIKLRFIQAYDCIEEVNLLIENYKYRAAVNRIYYGMFYMLLALAIKYNYKTSKHNQLIGWFNKNFIHKQLIDTKFGKMLNNAFMSRMSGDYDTYINFSDEEVKNMFNQMKDFITEIENFITNFN